MAFPLFFRGKSLKLRVASGFVPRLDVLRSGSSQNGAPSAS